MMKLKGAAKSNSSQNIEEIIRKDIENFISDKSLSSEGIGSFTKKVKNRIVNKIKNKINKESLEKRTKNISVIPDEYKQDVITLVSYYAEMINKNKQAILKILERDIKKKREDYATDYGKRTNDFFSKFIEDDDKKNEKLKRLTIILKNNFITSFNNILTKTYINDILTYCIVDNIEDDVEVIVDKLQHVSELYLGYMLDTINRFYTLFNHAIRNTGDHIIKVGGEDPEKSKIRKPYNQFIEHEGVLACTKNERKEDDDWKNDLDIEEWIQQEIDLDGWNRSDIDIVDWIKNKKRKDGECDNIICDYFKDRILAAIEKNAHSKNVNTENKKEGEKKPPKVIIDEPTGEIIDKNKLERCIDKLLETQNILEKWDPVFAFYLIKKHFPLGRYEKLFYLSRLYEEDILKIELKELKYLEDDIIRDIDNIFNYLKAFVDNHSEHTKRYFINRAIKKMNIIWQDDDEFSVLRSKMEQDIKNYLEKFPEFEINIASKLSLLRKTSSGGWTSR